MNIFILDYDPETCARYHCDKHVIKMVLETTQILSIVQYLRGNKTTYKPTHRHHPCVEWCNESEGNYRWLLWLGLYLCKEYTFRFGKTHKCESLLRNELLIPPHMEKKYETVFVHVMPDKYKLIDIVESYRWYYLKEKNHLFRWTKRKRPLWVH